MDDHFDICRVFKISKFDIARLTSNLKVYCYMLADKTCFSAQCYISDIL